MNSAAPRTRRLAAVLCGFLLVCLAAHFLHDLQSGGLDLPYGFTRACGSAIHAGMLAGGLPTVLLVLLALRRLFLAEIHPQAGFLPVPIHPPQVSIHPQIFCFRAQACARWIALE